MNKLNTKIILASVVFVVMGCASIQNASISDNKYYFSNDTVVIEFFLIDQKYFKLWIREAITSCYNAGLYKIRRNKINLLDDVSSLDGTKLIMYEIGKCEIQNSTIQILNKDSILFDGYVLQRVIE